jgi:branched-chain amino acid transport system permease protein
MSHDFGYWLQQAINFTQLACFYAPLAVAFAMLQAITRRIFLSFGDIAMFGSFAAIYANFAGQLRGDSDTMAAALALLMALACTAALGFAVARAFFGRSLLAHAQAFMIASIGLSIVLREVMRLQSNSRDIWVPPLFQGLTVAEYAGRYTVKLPVITLLAIAVSVTALIVTAIVLKWSRFGYNWRACAQSIELTRLCGIDTDKVIALTFAAAAALAAVSGWTSAVAYGGANFTIGLMMGFKAMFASVVGGFGSLRGALAGAVLIAAIEVLWSSNFNTAYRDVAVFAIMVFILLLRPEGLLGLSGRRESEAL